MATSAWNFLVSSCSADSCGPAWVQLGRCLCTGSEAGGWAARVGVRWAPEEAAVETHRTRLRCGPAGHMQDAVKHAHPGTARPGSGGSCVPGGRRLSLQPLGSGQQNVPRFQAVQECAASSKNKRLGMICRTRCPRGSRAGGSEEEVVVAELGQAVPKPAASLSFRGSPPSAIEKVVVARDARPGC